MPKRDDHDSSDTAVVETFRATSNPDAPPKKSEEDKMSLFWRVFGGTIISVAALAGITLYNTMSGNISELRAEVTRLNEAKVDAAKKDEVTALKTTAEGNRREIDGMKERLSKYRLELDAARKDLTTVEKDLQKELTATREKLARLEGQQQPMKPDANK